jgi:uncharacterized protein involved in exopolysaccharide biosynthesis
MSEIANIGYPQRSLRDFHYILFRHKWKVIVFFVAVMVTVTLGTFLAAEIYRAEAKLLVRIGRESVSLDPTATTGQTISIGQSRESEINSELEILKSRELAQKVVDALGPKAFLERPDEEIIRDPSTIGVTRDRIRDLRKSVRGIGKAFGSLLQDLDLKSQVDDREKAVIKLAKDLNIETQKNSNILFLSYEAQSQKFAESVLSRLIDFYLDKHITTHRTAGSFDFFDKQALDLRSQLARTEGELKALKNQTGVASLDDQRKIVLQRIGTLQQESEATQAALAISRAKVAELKEKLSGLSPTLVTQETKASSNYGVELMRSRLYELKLKEQELLSKYTETSIPVTEVRRQIAEAQAQLDKEEGTRTETTTAINTTYQQLNLTLITENATLSSLEAKARVVNHQLDAARREVKEINEGELRIVNLQRELALQDVKYRKYSGNQEQARIDQALETNKISNISVVQRATASAEPVRPRKALNLALGLFLGLLGGLGLAFFSEYLDHSIKTPEDVEGELKLQLLASIPYMKKNRS